MRVAYVVLLDEKDDTYLGWVSQEAYEAEPDKFKGRRTVGFHIIVRDPKQVNEFEWPAINIAAEETWKKHTGLELPD